MRSHAPMVLALVSLGCPSSPPGLVDDGTCTSWRAVRHHAALDDEALTEISGLARSHRIPDTLWVHQDRGDDPFVTAVDTSGAVGGTFSVVGATHEDWEDMALGPCGGGFDACSCLILADFGDNDRTRDAALLYRVPEPDAGDVDAGGLLLGAEEIWFRYPGGPRDAEALLVHPATGETLVVTKAEGSITEVFAFPGAPPAATAASAPVELMPVATLDLHALGASSRRVTAGDLSPRGRRAVLRTDEDILVFEVPDGGTAGDALQRDPLVLSGPAGENGEALAVSVDGTRLWLSGESTEPALWSISCASFHSDGDGSADPLVDCDGSD